MQRIAINCGRDRWSAPRSGGACRGRRRRTVFVVPVWLAVVAAVFGALVPHGRADDWPVAGGNPQGTGATDEALPDRLELLWQREFGGLGFEGGPIVVQGVVYVADTEGRVAALALADGAVRWEKQFDTGFVATPGYFHGRLYLGDQDGRFHALDPATGEEMWVYEADMEIDASPNAFQDSILFTSQNGTLYCVSRDQGMLRWKYETGDQLRCAPTLADTKTFLGGCDSFLHIVDVRDGQAADAPIPIDAPTGSTPAIVDNRVYVPTYAGEIFCFEVGKREPLWRFHDPQLSEEFRNSAAVTDGILVAASRHKRVFALNTADGSVRWVHVLRKRADASPVIAGQSVIVAAADGRIIRLDLKTGDQVWMTEVKGAFLGSPAIADGRLVLASDRGTVFCFGAK
ncbi:MAG: serine/threonine protein kinase [Pirellulaceae bacterium]|nr:MAG: serine/threonine protein kinase [Pirellulaceae bacterium]